MSAVELQVFSHDWTINGQLFVTVLSINVGNWDIATPGAAWVTGNDLIGDEPGVNMRDVILNDDLLRDEDRLWDFGDTVVGIFIAKTGWADWLVPVLLRNVTVGNVSTNDEGTISMDDGGTVTVRIAL